LSDEAEAIPDKSTQGHVFATSPPPFLGTDLKSVPTGGQGEDTVRSKNAPTKLSLVKARWACR